MICAVLLKPTVVGREGMLRQFYTEEHFLELPSD